MDYRYTYDPFGRRIKKETGGKTIWFGYDDTGLIAEYDETGTQLAAYGYWSGEKWQADPLYKRENTTYFFYHNDHLGTPQRLTNQQGEISWSADYEAFGAAKETVTVTSNPHRFPGQYYDEETGFYQNYFRTYDPNLGRYLEFDPLYQESIDPYGYARNNPLRYTDPTGEIAPLAGMYARCVLQCAGMTCLMGFVSGDGCNPCADAPDCLLDCLNPINWLGGGKKPPKPKPPAVRPPLEKPPKPPKPPKGYTCTCRADCDDNKVGNCPSKVTGLWSALGTAHSNSKSAAIKAAKSAATKALGAKPKHVGCVCSP